MDSFIIEKQIPEKFSLLNSIASGYFADLVYKEEEFIYQITEQSWNLYNAKYFDGVFDTQCCAVENDDYIFIAFRGTSSLQDVKEDLDMKLSVGPFKTDVHDGWWNCLNGVFNHLVEYINNAWKERGKRPLFGIGHSLGGSLLKLFMSKWVDENYGVVEDFCAGYTFGCPKVGSKKWAKIFDGHFKKRTFGLINHQDPIIQIPRFLPQYHHSGEICYYDSNRKLEVCIEESKKLDVLLWLDVNLDCHRLWTYIDNINRTLSLQ